MFFLDSADGEKRERRHSTSSMAVESSLCEQWRKGRVVGGGRCVGRYGALVLGLMGWEAMIAAREHLVSTIHVFLMLAQRAVDESLRKRM